MSVKISELPLLSDLADNDVLASVDTSANATKKIELATLKDYIDTNTTYTAGTNIDITNNVVSAPNVYNKNEMDSQIEELQSEVDSLNTIYNAFPTASGEGESVSLDGTAETKFKKFELQGNTSQTGTPTPSSPIPVNVVSGDNSIDIVGKNLLDLSTLVQGLYGPSSSPTIGYTSDGRYRTFSLKLKQGTYSICFSEGCLITRDFTSYDYSGNTTLGSFGSSTTKETFTMTQDGIAYFGFRKNDGTNWDNTNDKVWVVNGSQLISYETYNGNTYNIDLPVENLLDINLQSGSQGGISYVVNEDKSITLNGTNTSGSVIYIRVANNFTLPAGTYTLSNRNLLASNVTGALFYDDGNNFDRAGTNTKTFSNSVTIKPYIKVTNGATLNNITLFPIIEKGDKNNGYSPYGTTPIELCKIGDYKDYFLHDKTLDKWYKVGNVAKEDVGNLTISTYTSSTYGLYFYFSLPNAVSTAPMVYSRIYKKVEKNPSTWVDYTMTTDGPVTQIRDSRYSTKEAFKTSVSGEYFYYPLATPTNTEITYQPLINQLNAIENAMSKKGQTNISQVNNDLPFIISCEAILSLNNVLDRITLLEG